MTDCDVYLISKDVRWALLPLLAPPATIPSLSSKLCPDADHSIRRVRSEGFGDELSGEPHIPLL
jgi:hypothetical protein